MAQCYELVIGRLAADPSNSRMAEHGNAPAIRLLRPVKSSRSTILAAAWLGSPRFWMNGGGSTNALEMVDPVTVSYFSGGRVISRPMGTRYVALWRICAPANDTGDERYQDEAGSLWNAFSPTEPYFYWTDTSWGRLHAYER